MGGEKNKTRQSKREVKKRLQKRGSRRRKSERENERARESTTKRLLLLFLPSIFRVHFARAYFSVVIPSSFYIFSSTLTCFPCIPLYSSRFHVFHPSLSLSLPLLYYFSLCSIYYFSPSPFLFLSLPYTSGRHASNQLHDVAGRER